MRFHTTLLAQLAFAILGSASTLPAAEPRSASSDGIFLSTRYANGTVTTIKVEDFSTSSTATQRVSRSASNALQLRKRGGDCWYSAGQNHQDIDESVIKMKNWAGVNGRDLTSYGSTAWVHADGWTDFVYYCIITPWRTGNLNIADIDYALWRMDEKCGTYQAGWFRWDGSDEIFGKARHGSAVCVG